MLLGNFLRKYTNDKLAYIVVRWKNILFSQWFFFNRARAQPKKVKEWLIDQVKNKLGPNYNIEKGIREVIKWMKNPLNLSMYKSDLYNV